MSVEVPGKLGGLAEAGWLWGEMLLTCVPAGRSLVSEVGGLHLSKPHL